VAGAVRKGKTPEERLMYAKYLAQSAGVYFSMADMLNLHFTGHHFWENDDPTYVDMGDGRKMQLSKHFMEGVHWLQDPGKTLMNKMGPIPAELLTQSLNKEYLSPKGSPDIVEKPNERFAAENQAQVLLENVGARTAHALKRFAPITAPLIPAIAVATNMYLG